MLRQVLFYILVLGLISVSLSSSKRKIEKGRIYKIFNKAENAVLTIAPTAPNLEDFKVRIQPWNDAGGQKWKAKQSMFSKSYEFEPTSNEHARLEADDRMEDNLSFVFSRASGGKDKNAKYWIIEDVGEGSFKIKSYKSKKLCITSQGLDKPVQLIKCENTPQQQWDFQLL